MKIPKRLQPLLDDGVIDDVIGQLMSGKEATVYTVLCGDEVRCAKVYKDAVKRSFKKASQYVEGRKVRNSRRQRAMEKGSKFGRKQQEEIWHNTEVDALYKLDEAGIRVPKPYGCFDGVLLMELITDIDGDVAPRLNDVEMSAEEALEDHATMVDAIKRMLCIGLIHGDLSEFNVLIDSYGPVVIDLPQVVDAAANNNAFSMLCRDVENMRNYYGQYAPELKQTHFAEEMWALYEDGNLHPDTELTGEFADSEDEADVDAVLDEIKAIMAEEEARKERLNELEQDDY